MLKQLLQRVAFEVVGIVVLAFAAGVAVVAAAGGLYALLRTYFNAPASAGLTSLAAVVLVAVLAVVVIQVSKKRAAAQRDSKPRRVDSDTIQQALAVGAALTGVLADVVLERRLDRRSDKQRRGRGGKRK